jgi:sialate O-acetylesterase
MKPYLILLPLLLPPALTAEVKLSPLFSDHGVLQRDRPIPIWGTATPGEVVHVSLGKQAAQATADAAGNWRVVLPSLPAGGPFEMKVTASNKIALHDILIGEVWLASGQSNMEIGMGIVKNLPQELAAASHPQLRIFTVARNQVADPADTLNGKWVVSLPDTAKDFSATPYFFGSSLLAALHIPVGIINSSVGNTPAESWTPFALLKDDPLFSKAATQQVDDMRRFVSVEQTKKELEVWEKQNDATDPGNTGFAKNYAATPMPPDGWKTITLPIDGPALRLKGAAAIWVRRDITLPDRKYDKPASLDLGPMREQDTVYFDGVKVGEAPPEPEPFDRNAVYPLPASLLHPGTHSITVRVFSHQPRNLYLGSRLTNLSIPDSGSQNAAVKIMLSGEWSYRIEHEGPPIGADAAKTQPALIMRPIGVASANFNGMIYPLKDYSLRGVVWYQGENNAPSADNYPALMTHLILSWREQFKQPKLPFYLVQLPNIGEPWTSGWDNMRAQQESITKILPNVGMAVTIDIGEQHNIHPHNKRPVGERLALLALHRDYGMNFEDSGPTYTGMKVEGSKVRIELSHANGLKATSPNIPNFAIAGADEKFYPAKATIEGTTIVVVAPEVMQPVAVRYARTQDPEGCDVYNGANLPMPPFRTDDWAISKR